MATVAVGGPGRTRTKAHKTSIDAGQAKLAAMLISPTFLVLALVVAYPLVSSFKLAFTVTHNGINPSTGLVDNSSTFGIANFTGIFHNSGGAGSVTFERSLINTTTFTVAGTVLETVIGMLMALIMAKAFAGRAVVRAAILVPWAIPTAMSALLWKWIFQPAGIANVVLHKQVLWGTDGIQAWASVVIADTWKTAPFIGLLVLAGLQTIPGEVYEAAKMDGISTWQTFVRITLPLVKPALIVAVLFRLLDNLRMFDLPYLLTQLGKTSTSTVSMQAFQEAIQNNRFGTGAAYSIVLFVYIALVAFVFVKVLGADIIGARTGGRGRANG